MIHPNELRIGNWVKYKKYSVKLLASEIVLIEQGKIKCEPIPLTPEVLEKCPQVTKRDGYPYKILNGHIVKRADGKYIFKYYDIYVVLDYLHQLQNLYFALTGEELEYKP